MTDDERQLIEAAHELQNDVAVRVLRALEHGARESGNQRLLEALALATTILDREGAA